MAEHFEGKYKSQASRTKNLETMLADLKAKMQVRGAAFSSFFLWSSTAKVQVRAANRSCPGSGTRTGGHCHLNPLSNPSGK